MTPYCEPGGGSGKDECVFYQPWGESQGLLFRQMLSPARQVAHFSSQETRELSKKMGRSEIKIVQVWDRETNAEGDSGRLGFLST